MNLKVKRIALTFSENNLVPEETKVEQRALETVILFNNVKDL